MRGFAVEALDIFERVIKPVGGGLFEVDSEVFEAFAVEVRVEVVGAEHVPVLRVALKMRIIHEFEVSEHRDPGRVAIRLLQLLDCDAVGVVVFEVDVVELHLFLERDFYKYLAGLARAQLGLGAHAHVNWFELEFVKIHYFKSSSTKIFCSCVSTRGSSTST